MSVFAGPYTTIAVPPTAGALPIIQQANESTPVSGGGGPIGPNPVVSSLTVAVGGTITFLNDNSWDNQGIFWNTDATATSTVKLIPQYLNDETGSGGIGMALLIDGTQSDFFNLGVRKLCLEAGNGGTTPGAVIQNDPTNFGTAYVSSLRVSSLNGVAPGSAVIPGDLAVSTLTMGIPGGIVGVSSIEGLNGTLPLLGNVSISSLSVSSINNAAPGGGVGPELGTSSITASTLSLYPSTTSGLIYAGGSITSPVGLTLTPLTGQYGNSGVIGAWGQEVYGGQPGYAEFATQRLYLTDATGQATNLTFIQNFGNQISIQTPSSISLQAPTSVSSLLVSSINNAAPGGGGALKFSTLSVPGGAGTQFPVDPGTATPIISFSTTAGHTYSASCYARAVINVVPATAGDMIYTEILDNNTGNDPLGAWLASNVSTMASNGSFYQQVGGTTTWKAAGDGAAFSVYTMTSTTIFMDGVNVIDYGAI